MSVKLDAIASLLLAGSLVCTALAENIVCLLSFCPSVLQSLLLAQLLLERYHYDLSPKRTNSEANQPFSSCSLAKAQRNFFACSTWESSLASSRQLGTCQGITTRDQNRTCKAFLCSESAEEYLIEMSTRKRSGKVRRSFCLTLAYLG